MRNCSVYLKLLSIDGENNSVKMYINTDGKVFEGNAMASLYAKLTGSAAKNDISDVDNLLQDIEAVTAADIRAKNALDTPLVQA